MIFFERYLIVALAVLISTHITATKRDGQDGELICEYNVSLPYYTADDLNFINLSTIVNYQMGTWILENTTETFTFNEETGDIYVHNISKLRQQKIKTVTIKLQKMKNHSFETNATYDSCIIIDVNVDLTGEFIGSAASRINSDYGRAITDKDNAAKTSVTTLSHLTPLHNFDDTKLQKIGDRHRNNHLEKPIMRDVPSNNRTNNANFQLQSYNESLLFADRRNKISILGNETEISSMFFDVPKRTISLRDVDTSAPKATTLVTVLANLVKTSDIAPRFGSKEYNFLVPENVGPHFIATLQAVHPSFNDENRLLYSIKSGLDSSFFTIDQNTGDLSSASSFDYENRTDYRITVLACMATNDSLCGSADVTFHIVDENDNAPVFQQSLYVVDLPVGIPAGYEVVQIHADDNDGGNNGEISYAMKTNNGCSFTIRRLYPYNTVETHSYSSLDYCKYAYLSGVFSVDYETGIVRTAASLNEAKVFELQIEAFDHGSPSKRSSALIKVTVHDSNPSAPEFDKFLYEVTKSSPIPAGSVLVQLHATDPDPGPEGEITYRFAESNDDETVKRLSKFRLNPTNGQLSTVERLSSENSTSLQFLVEAVDGSTTLPRKSQTVVHIDIVSNTGEHLEFLPLPKRVFISSSNPPGSVILRAVTSHTVRPPKFSIEYNAKNDDLFEMYGDELRVKTNLTEGSYNVTIHAELGTSTVEHFLNIVVMAERDKYPVFSHLAYDIKVPLNITSSSVIHSFSAALNNASIIYSVYPSESLPKGLRLDSHTGDLYADKEFVNVYRYKSPSFLVVRARNAAFPEYYSDVAVALSVAKPHDGFGFPASLYRLEVAENSEIGTALNTAITVSDESAYDDIRYQLESTDLFNVDRSGVIHVAAKIDAEKLPLNSKGIIRFVIHAFSNNEHAKADVEVKIIDIDEFQPKFERSVFVVNVPENIISNEIVGRVYAIDNDISAKNRISYQVLGNASNFIQIMENGSVIVTNYTIFDREVHDVYNISIVTKVNGTVSDKAILQLNVMDVNDNAPIFTSQLIWNIPEGRAGLDSKFLVTAEDKDNGENGSVSFRLLQGNSATNFELRELTNNTAEIRVVRPFDRESKSHYVLTIEARDHGRPSLFSMANIDVYILDVNDNPPIFSTSVYNQTVPFNLPDGFPLITVHANDMDINGELIYKIQSDPSRLFSMDRKSGAIFFAVPPEKRKTGTYKVEVAANDGNFTSVATVFIHISEMLENGSLERNETVRNHAPIFSKDTYNFSVFEGSVGDVGVIEVKDPDMDKIDLKIEPISSRRLFAVDSKTGVIKVRVPLYYSPSEETSSFLVIAQDNGSPPLTAFANIVINITDVNDHAPEFDHTVYSVILPPSPVIPYQIPLEMNVHDADFGENAKLRFSLGGPDQNCFTVDAALGTVTLNCAIDYFRKSSYSLTMIATDRNGEGQSTEAAINILVRPPPHFSTTIRTIQSVDFTKDVQSSTESASNEICVPVFPVPIIEVDLPSYAPSKEPIYTLMAQCQCKKGCNPEYRLENPALNDYFSLKSDGKLFIVRTINPDDLRINDLINDDGQLVIAISARIQNNIDRATILFDHIHSSLISPNSGLFPDVTSTETSDVFIPRFSHQIYTSSMPEGMYGSGTVIPMKPGRIQATIPDRASSASVIYSISSDLSPLPFIIKSDTGELLIYGNIDREDVALYDLDITATNSEYPSKIGRAKVKVRILDVNDNYPIFHQPIHVIAVAKDSRIDQPVGKFFATDNDEGRFGVVRYSLNDDNDLLSIDPKSGLVFAKKSLHKAKSQSYNLEVVASDLGRPPLKTFHPITLELFDSVNGDPEFRPHGKWLTVNDGMTKGDIVTQVVAGVEDVKYSIDDSISGLFDISPEGIITLDRTPIKPELDRNYTLTVKATKSDGRTASTAVNVYVGNSSPHPVSKNVSSNFDPDSCHFTSELYNVWIRENVPGRTSLLNVTSDCSIAKRSVRYSIAQGASIFGLDPTTGELFVKDALDRENRSLHFIIINVTAVDLHDNNDSKSRISRRQSNPIIEHAKSKLKSWQALVAVHVIDENDNPPHFLQQNSDGVLVFVVDWQAPVFTPFARIRAEDLDEKATILYFISPKTASSAENFNLNSSSGVLSLKKSLIDVNTELFKFTVIASDGTHNVTSPVHVHRLSLETNIVIVAVNSSKEDIASKVVEKRLSELTGQDVHVLVKQTYLNSKLEADPRRTHLFIYALDRISREPLNRDEVKRSLDTLQPQVQDILPGIESSLSQTDSSRHWPEIILVIICALLLLVACCMLFYISRSCKRRGSEKFDDNYMFDSQSAGPRPYDVERIDRKTAQSVLSSRPLPNPYESYANRDRNLDASPPMSCTLTSDDPNDLSYMSNMNLTSRRLKDDRYGTFGPRSTRFNGDVMQVHDLVRKQLDKDSTEVTIPTESMFPVYRKDGYSS